MSTYQTPRLTIRLYDNPKFGARSGPNRTNQLIFNCMVTLPEDGKIYVDLARPEQIEQAVDPNSPHMLVVLNEMAAQLAQSPQQDVLVGQLKMVDPIAYLDGGVVVNLQTRELRVFLYSEEQLVFHEQLELTRCRKPLEGEKAPNYWATNHEFGPAALAPDAAAHAKATAMLDQMTQRSIRRARPL
jgi:hypothetical protein